MKVTLIGTLPPLKGISPYCLELTKILSKHCKVDFIGFKSLYPEFLYPGGTKTDDNSFKPDLKDLNVKNVLTWYNPFSWLWVGLSIKSKVVHVQWWAYPLAIPYFIILSILKIRKKTIVITVHNVLPHEKSWMKNLLNRLILKFGDMFIVHSDQNKFDLNNMFEVSEEKIYVIPHGVLEYPRKDISKTEARTVLNIPEDKKVILFFGNIREYKGLDILIKAFRIVKDKVDNSCLLITGQPWGKWEIYASLINELKLEEDIILKLDFIPPSDVELYFSASDLLVLPYKYFDSQSGVGALALFFKRPLIVTDVGGLPDFVKDEGAIAKPNDAEDLAEKIIQILKDDELLEKLSIDSGDLAQKYSWEEIAFKTINVYRQVKK